LHTEIVIDFQTPINSFSILTAMKQFLFILSVALFASCSHQSSDVKKLQQENDSLLQAKSHLENETNDYLTSMNEIEDNFSKIKEMENYIQVNKSSENTPDIRTKINDDVIQISEILKANKEKLAILNHKLSRSNLRIAALEQTVARLNTTLNEKIQIIQSLSDELKIKDATITELSKNVDTLHQTVNTLSEQKQQQQNELAAQDAKLHTAWYVFGTAKELKAQKIITSGGLFSSEKVLQKDFNKQYFVKIDIRQVKTIPLYSKKVKILTTHPQGSYSLDKKDGNYVLTIKDYNEFWSVSRYLVIQVD
jgi:DNA repair exonuclease SbcCD ATPase subunit